MASNRRDFFLDTILGGILADVDATLSKVFEEPEEFPAGAKPRISYHLTDDRKSYANEDAAFQFNSTQGFVLFAYTRTKDDTAQRGLLAAETNRVIDAVEKAFESHYGETWQLTDTNGQVIATTVRIDDVVPILDFGQGMAAIEFTGTITYNKGL